MFFKNLKRCGRYIQCNTAQSYKSMKLQHLQQHDGLGGYYVKRNKSDRATCETKKCNRLVNLRKKSFCTGKETQSTK